MNEQTAIKLIKEYAVKYEDNPAQLNFEVATVMIDFCTTEGYSELAMAIDDSVSTEGIWL